MTNKKSASLQRVLDVAAEFFLASRFESVSMTAIAQAAHCSTTTMYDVYGSKESLFVAAMRARLRPAPILRPHGESGFKTLLEYALIRISEISTAETRLVVGAVLQQYELMRDIFAAGMDRSREESDLALFELIRSAQQEGMLRPLPEEVVLDSFRCFTAFEPLLSLFYGSARHVSPRRIVFGLFTPLVTERGEAALRDFIDERFGL
jgi:AcrR family transcriptional regulator